MYSKQIRNISNILSIRNKEIITRSQEDQVAKGREFFFGNREGSNGFFTAVTHENFFNALPYELILKICEFLNLEYLRRLALTNQLFRNLINLGIKYQPIVNPNEFPVRKNKISTLKTITFENIEKNLPVQSFGDVLQAANQKKVKEKELNNLRQQSRRVENAPALLFFCLLISTLIIISILLLPSVPSSAIFISFISYRSLMAGTVVGLILADAICMGLSCLAADSIADRISEEKTDIKKALAEVPNFNIIPSLDLKQTFS